MPQQKVTGAGRHNVTSLCVHGPGLPFFAYVPTPFFGANYRSSAQPWTIGESPGTFSVPGAQTPQLTKTGPVSERARLLLRARLMQLLHGFYAKRALDASMATAALAEPY